MDISAAFQNFKNQYTGQRIADPLLGQLGANSLPASQWYQCVSLVKQYLRDLFGLNPGFWGDAIVYYKNPNAALLTRFVKVGGSDALVGDVVVINGLAGNPAGHIGIATGNHTASQVEILEQNGSTGNGTGTAGDAIRTRYIDKDRVAGLLRPIGVSYGEAPAPAPAPSNTIGRIGQFLNLSPSVTSWRVYRVGGPWTIGNEIAKLNPQQYGGLSYEVVSSPAANFYVIQTQMFGQVAIYAGSETPATYSDTPAYGASVAPPPAPAPTPPAAPPVAVPPNTEYTKLDQPLNLVTKASPTHLWDLGFADDAHATSLEDLAQGASFVAYGKAQRTDHDRPAYFMTEADFGSADTTGAPARNAGVNTVDLAPAEAPVASEVLGAETEAAIVPVRVEPTDPEKWKQSYTAFLGPVNYRANQNYLVQDVDGQSPATQLVKGQPVVIAGLFEKDSQKYYRTGHSVAANAWYGLPEAVLTKEADAKDDSFLDETLKEVPKITAILAKPSNNAKIIAFFATIDGLLVRIFHRK